VTPHPPPPGGTGRNRIVLLLAGFALLAAGFVASVVFAAGWSGAAKSRRTAPASRADPSNP
jgi:hypothetical protein